MNEKWSQKYKRSIDCNNPKGFSQKAHCQGRKKNEMKLEEKLNLFLEKNCPTDPGKWSASKAAAKRKFDVYPSAYANGWAAKNYKSKGGGWKKCGKNESYDPAMGGWVEPSNRTPIENPFGDDDTLDEKNFATFFTKVKDSIRKFIRPSVYGDTLPSNVDKLAKIIDNDRAFHIDFITFIDSKAEKYGNTTSIAYDMIKLPSFKKLFDKFVKDNNLSKKEKEDMENIVRRSFDYTLDDKKSRKNLMDTLKAKYPNIVKDKQLKLKSNLEEGPCWKGYQQVGMKTKNGKQVPNCVPVNEVINTKTHKAHGSMDHNFNHHHKGSMYAPDMGYPAEFDTYDFDDTIKKGIGHQTDTEDTEDRGYEPVKKVKNNESYNPADDFMKAMSGKQPAEVFRVHAELENGKIGISAWYTKDVIDDIVRDVKKVGAKIKKIEKKSLKDIKIENMKKEEYPDHPQRRDTDAEIDYGYVEPEEYDVDNYDDYLDFVSYMRNYKNELAEAGCNCVYEAEYQGRQVKLGKPMRGDVKKFKVYVKNPQGNIVKVNFGDPNMRIKKSNPARRKSFRARHNCDNPGPRHKARYWSCRKW